MYKTLCVVISLIMDQKSKAWSTWHGNNRGLARLYRSTPNKRFEPISSTVIMAHRGLFNIIGAINLSDDSTSVIVVCGVCGTLWSCFCWMHSSSRVKQRNGLRDEPSTITATSIVMLNTDDWMHRVYTYVQISHSNTSMAAKRGIFPRKVVIC